MGDDGAYAFRTASWISENGLVPYAAGPGRGEQAMGHPILFFWLWAALIRLFGNTLAVARILPTIATTLALAGTWKLAETLSRDRLAGAVATLGLLATPVFATQMFRPLPDVAFVAVSAWATLFFFRNRLLPALLLTCLAAALKEQGALLAVVFLAGDIVGARRFRPGMLLWLCPLLVTGITLLSNLLVNGYVVYRSHFTLETSSVALPHNWFRYWLGYFGGGLLGWNYRWIPVSVALAVVLSARRERLSLPVIAALLSPALFLDSHTFVYTLLVGALALLAVAYRGGLRGRIETVSLLMPAAPVVFLLALVPFTAGSNHDLLRYLLGAFPLLMALLVSRLLSAGRGIALPVWGAFVAASLSTFGRVCPGAWQFEDSPVGLAASVAFREAVAASENPFTQRDGILEEPALGFVDSPRPFREGAPGEFVLFDPIELEGLPEGYALTGDTVYEWRHRGLSVLSLGMVPSY